MIHDRDLFDLLEHTADAAFVVSDVGEICSWNASAESLFGFARVEAVGRTAFELLQPRGPVGAQVFADRGHVRDSAWHSAAIPDCDVEVATRSGRRIWVNLSTVVHLEPRAGRPRLVHFARSIADRKRRDALVRRLVWASRQLVEMSGDGPDQAPAVALTERERRVLRGFSEGMGPSDLSHELGISSQTLRNHLHHINKKLGTHSRLQAVVHAIRRKLV